MVQVNWTSDRSVEEFKDAVYELNRPYEGASMMVMRFKNVDTAIPWPSPIVFHDACFDETESSIFVDGEHMHRIRRQPFRVFNRADYQPQYQYYYDMMPNFSKIHNPKDAGHATEDHETTATSLAFQGTMRVYNEGGTCLYTVSGNGHHGVDYVGVASIRAGKGVEMGAMKDVMLTRPIG